MRVKMSVVFTTAWLLIGVLTIPVEALAWTLSTPGSGSFFGKAASIPGTGLGNQGDAGAFYFGHLNGAGLRVAENSIAFNVPVIGMGGPAMWNVTLPPPPGAGNVWTVGPDHHAWVSGAGQQGNRMS